jgi:membrane protease YdiL (CAAX protease family)
VEAIGIIARESILPQARDRAGPDYHRHVPALVALLALIVGFLGMAMMQMVAAPVGLRGALLLGQVALLAPFWLSRRAGALPREVFGMTWPSAAGVALSLACGGALWVAAAGLLQVQYVVWRVPPDVLPLFESLHARLDLWPPWQAALSLVAIALGPALSEEVAFRGAVLGTLRRPLGDRGAVLASAALFGLIHLWPAGYRVPFALALGLALGALRLRTGSIVPGILAHATLNTTTVIVTRAAGGAAGTPESASIGGGLLALALGTAAAVGLASVISTREGRVVHSTG